MNYQLDKNQTELVKHNGNAFVIAGAGSGKTLTIIEKIKYLIANNICKAENILVISYTNASVNDISKKIIYNVDVMTFHKLAIKILKKTNYIYNICNDDLLSYLIKEYIETCSNYEKRIILKFTKFKNSFYIFEKSKAFKHFKSFIATFINLYKTNDINCDFVLSKKYTKIEKNILIIIFRIYKIYLEEKQSTQKVDFDDLIIIATKKVKESGLKYKYIIIDEFQDTSQIRLNLIKAIYTQSEAKIIVVGDDYQSIYRFSGCDLNIFLNFTKIFPNTKIIKLLNTYRNSQELITIASKFICKNPLQIKKELLSTKHSSSPIVFAPYLTKLKIIKKILNIVTKKTNDIMILARNNDDIYNYIDNNIKYKDDLLYYKGHEIKYFTIHKSKGLEADIVIVLNCNNEYLGFPNKIENNKLIDKIIANNEIKYAEERRLFYVALTRCKKEVILVYDKNNPSIFIKEIKRIVKKQMHKINYY